MSIESFYNKLLKIWERENQIEDSTSIVYVFIVYLNINQLSNQYRFYHLNFFNIAVENKGEMSHL